MALASLPLAVQCAPAVKRDFSATPVGQVGFDDMCGLQIYFDKIETKEGTAPRIVTSAELERERPGVPRSGRSRFAFETPFELESVRRVLEENWRRLPEETEKAPRIEIQVRWSEKAGVRRVVTNEDAELTVGDVNSRLPYHPCLSELLFGEPLYKQRRVVLGLPPLPVTASWLSWKKDRDGGVPDGGAADAKLDSKIDGKIDNKTDGKTTRPTDGG